MFGTVEIWGEGGSVDRQGALQVRETKKWKTVIKEAKGKPVGQIVECTYRETCLQEIQTKTVDWQQNVASFECQTMELGLFHRYGNP